MKTKTKKAKTNRARKQTAGQQPKPTLVVFVLDRTGSMAQCKSEAISGFNSYVDGLGDTPNMRLTLVQFDSESIDTVHEAVALSKVNRLTDKTFTPRAMTPLHDAVGRTIKATQAKAQDSKVLFVTLTDGQENASSEWDATTLKALMVEREKQDKWTFVHIGVGPGGWAAAAHLAAGTQSHSNVLRTDGKNVARSLRRAGAHSVCYASSVGTNDTVATDFFAGQTDDTKKPS